MVLVIVLATSVFGDVHWSVLCDIEENTVGIYTWRKKIYNYGGLSFYNTQEMLSYLQQRYGEHYGGAIYDFAKRTLNDPVTKLFFDVMGIE